MEAFNPNLYADEEYRLSPRKFWHRQKMERKDLDRDERSARRSKEYERLKFFSPFIVRKMRKWLKSPYAFRGAA